MEVQWIAVGQALTAFGEPYEALTSSAQLVRPGFHGSSFRIDTEHGGDIGDEIADRRFMVSEAMRLMLAVGVPLA